MGGDLFRKKSVEKILKDAALSEDEGLFSHLKRSLGVFDLTILGIAAIVGAGIFSTIGKASFDGGPGIVFLFLFAAIACGFSAFCYAEFASLVPVSGSAYTYSYVAFGEFIAWIIGWNLLMEYAIGNIAVAISWSDYFTTLMAGLGIHIPEWLTMDYWTAKSQTSEAQQLAWNTAPTIGNLRIICDLPAFGISVLIAWITYIGIRESKVSANIMVALKMAVILIVIVVGASYIKPENWSPFMPNGIGGILKGTAAVFFAYIGFDALSTMAEECKNPQRDLPRSMIYSLIICTVIYIIIAMVLTGMTHYTNLNVGDPMAFVFNQVGLDWLAGVIAVSAVIATASVLLVFQVGQPRIWMSMSRDGLLPPIFSKIHPKYKTPSFSTIVAGIIVAVPALFLNLDIVISLTSIGTLFAFVLVCGGVLVLAGDPNRIQPRFKIPYLNAKYVMPFLAVAIVWLLGEKIMRMYGETGFAHIIPYLVFLALTVYVTVLSVLKNYSLIPVLGLISCSYLLCESGASNWTAFLIWLAVGQLLYFVYGFKHSKLKVTN